MSKFIAFLYGLVAYLIFFVTFLYAIGFVEGMMVPKAIDTGAVVPVAEALIVNILLMSLFAVQHSMMARRQFKDWWTQFVPKPVERSTYVLLASLALALLFWQWRPIPTVVWQVANPGIANAILGLSLIGWLLVRECQIFCVRGFREGGSAVGTGISRIPPSNAWWPTRAGQPALSRP